MSASPDPSLPPRPHAGVALLLLHAQQGGDFLSDTPFAWVAGRLRSQGIGARLVHVHYPRGDPQAVRRVNQALIAEVAGDALVVFDQAWDADVLAQMGRTGALLCCTDPFAQLGRTRIDFVLDGFLRDRRGLLDLCARCVRGGTLGDIAGLRIQLEGMAEPVRTRPWTEPAGPPPPLLPFDPVTDAVVIGEPRNLDGSLPPVRRTLETNVGCPFADPVARNPAFAGADLSAPGITLKGCSFCFMGGDYKASPAADTVAASLAQIRYWQEHLPRLDEIVLRDQSALRYLPELVEALVRSGLKPAGILVPGRGDAILRFGEQLRRAVAICGASGWWFTIHLVGFESFSQRQLDLYNKGVTVGEYAQALDQMRALHREAPEVFRLYAHGASSFILFNPWTTLQDLQETVDFCDRNSVGPLAHGMTLSRLRLYPNLPLYWLAKRDGLLRETDAAVVGPVSAGYSAEAAWAYRDPRIAAVEALQDQLGPRVVPEQSVGLLRAVLEWARRGVGLEDAAAVEQAFCAAQRLWRQPARAETAGGKPGLARSAQAQQRTVSLGRWCNQHCATCVAGRSQLEDDTDRLIAAARRAAQTGQVVLTGREPALVPGLLHVVRAARSAGARDVELQTNGRFLASPGTPARLRGAGVTRLAIKRHRLADGDEDGHVAVPGAGAQINAGIAAAQAAGLPWAAVLVGTRQGWHELPDLVQWAIERGAREVRLQVLAGELPLHDLQGVAQAIELARARVEGSNVRWEIEGP